ncbi:MAG: hypothetical protein HY735_36195 [Verrucomicrobia bacterium]|nr:hypothetical protein [Verrucomicrobiota bacterium]
MRSFIVPAVVWGYVFSVLFGQQLWGAAFDRLMYLIDLSPNQGWILPLMFNFLVAIVGLPSNLKYALSLRRRLTLPVSDHVAAAMCFVGVCLCLKGAVFLGVSKREQIAAGASESLGGQQRRVFEAGRIEDGKFFNNLIGISFDLPTGWHSASLNAIRRALYSVAFAMAKENAQTVKELSAPAGTFPLLCAYQYPDTHGGYNPSLYTVAYSKEVLAASGVDTLEAYARGFREVQHPYHAIGDVLLEQFTDSAGYHVHIEGRFPRGTFQQHVYVVETGRHYVSLTASAMAETDMAIMRRAISTLQVHRTQPVSTATAE